MRLRVFLCGFIIEAFCFVCLLKMYENPKFDSFAFFPQVFATCVESTQKLHDTSSRAQGTSGLLLSRRREPEPETERRNREIRRKCACVCVLRV